MDKTVEVEPVLVEYRCEVWVEPNRVKAVHEEIEANLASSGFVSDFGVDCYRDGELFHV